MKKYRYIIYLVILCFLVVFLFITNINIYKNNEKMHDKFLKYNIIDVKGNANLSELKSIREELSNELFSYNNIGLSDFSNRLINLKNNNKSLSTELKELSNVVNSLTDRKNSLTREYNTLYSKLIKRKEEIRRSNSVFINNVPTINQYPRYPTGCESVALTILSSIIATTVILAFASLQFSPLEYC